MMELATFGGGCFWCMEDPFSIEGVDQVLPGYMGGHTVNPSYQDVCTGTTGHVEVVQMSFKDPKLYPRLLERFFQNIDPTDDGGQFADRGSQYVPVIFTHSDEQTRLAQDSLLKLEQSKRFPQAIAVAIRPAQIFYQAEAYHCRYAQKNPVAYQNYRQGSGRTQFLKDHWS